MNLEKPSKFHPNRRPWNWLVYDSLDQIMVSASSEFKGVVYDLGSGDSPYKNWLSQFVSDYVAVDWPKSIHGGAPDVSADLNESLPIDSGVADTVMSISVLEHLHNPGSMLCEANRILKPGGSLILQVPWQWRLHEEPHDYFRYTPFGLRLLLGSAGFENVEIKPQAGFFSSLILKINYFSLRFIHGPRLVRGGMRVLLWPCWQVGQLLAPLLDKLDHYPESETPGYFVTAKKSSLTQRK